MMNDQCVSFNLDNNIFRGRIVRLDHVMNEILTHHKYPDNVAAAVAETSALGVLLADLMKFNGIFTLQMQGDGPISVLVADVTSEGKVRACAKFDEEKMHAAQVLRKTEGELESTPHWLGHGSLVFTIDQGKNTDLYQGIVDLQGKNLEECALRYFKYSEQIDTHLHLYLQKDGDVWKSAGILIQKMPTKGGLEHEITENPEELWNENKILMDSLQKSEIFNTALPLEDILFRLFHEHQVRIVKHTDYHFGCRCSREKLINTLSAMGEKDIDDMIENGKITATCQFCGQVYAFDKSELVKH
ncbi:MAG: Hsp33 family molecular chaperone HslO [Alphaproteobacteria bacterium]|nr:Hsp33 family molecular chaperone HslO [Alphaproteobacteria bacterium]